MNLGAFSVSLAVSDIHKSLSFYSKLGFEQVGGNIEQNWLILRSGTTTIGLFQGMFESNIMTFNPGWDAHAQPLDEFTDIRDLQKAFKEAGINFQSEADPESTGPANFVVVDPDGNAVLFDQHV